MRPGELLTRDRLLDSVWGHRYVTASALNRVIAMARRAFGDDADRPKFIQTVHGAGYRFVGPIETAISVAAEARARFGPPAPARLPARLQSFIGRERELARIGDMLEQGRALTIVGTGGMGKTQCAIVFAHARATALSGWRVVLRSRAYAASGRMAAGTRARAVNCAIGRARNPR